MLQAFMKEQRAGEGSQKVMGSDGATYAPTHLPYDEPLPVQLDSPSLSQHTTAAQTRHVEGMAR